MKSITRAVSDSHAPIRAIITGLLCLILSACNNMSTQAEPSDFKCEEEETGSGSDKALLVCIVFKKETADDKKWYCPEYTLFGGKKQDEPGGIPVIKKSERNKQRIQWQAVEKVGSKYKTLPVLYKIASDPFSGTPIFVPSRNADGVATSKQLVSDCEKYQKPCIVEADYKYTIQKFLPKDPPTHTEPFIDTRCNPPLDPVFRVDP